jgi:GNAT superfamily N-acetyltransferase
MAALSQLAEFAKNYRPLPAPGVEVIVSGRCVMRVVADFPIAGPNSVSWIRCRPSDVDGLVREVESTFGAHSLPMSWVLDPGTEPSDLGDRLLAHGYVPDVPDNEVSVMILPAGAALDSAPVPGVAIHDAYADLDTFSAAERVAAEAFAGIPYGEPTGLENTRELRLANNRAAGNMRGVLATVEGEPAGSSTITLFPPEAAMITGGAVRPRFRGRGVYRAMVASRLGMAVDAGAAGLMVWGGHMSGPLLARMGFQTVSWRRFYIKGR